MGGGVELSGGGAGLVLCWRIVWGGSAWVEKRRRGVMSDVRGGGGAGTSTRVAVLTALLLLPLSCATATGGGSRA